MNLKKKEQTLSFVKEIDKENIYNYIINFEYSNKDGFEQRVLSIYESLFKSVFLQPNYKIYIKSLDSFEDPNIHALLNFKEPEIVYVRNTILKLNEDDIDLLNKVKNDVRNHFTHGKYKLSEEERKEKLSKLLFNSLKNAYIYKTNTLLEISFEDFFDAFKYSKMSYLESENKVLIEQNQNNADLIKKLNDKYELAIKKVNIDIKSTDIDLDNTVDSNVKTDEIKYPDIEFRHKYVIPKILGEPSKVVHSNQIDIAFDLIERGWFTEASEEVSRLKHPLTKYITFLSQNKFKNVNELILSKNYLKKLNELISLLDELPVESSKDIIRQIICSFKNIANDDITKKTSIFKILITIRNNEDDFKDNFLRSLILSNNQILDYKKEGFDAFYSSFNGEEYEKAVISSFSLMLSLKKFDLIFYIKNKIFNDYINPELAEILFLAQLQLSNFESIGDYIYKLEDTTYLDLLLNYYFYHDCENFKFLSSKIIECIQNSLEILKSSVQKTNIIKLTNSVIKYIDEEETQSLLSLLKTSLKNRNILLAHFEDWDKFIALCKKDKEYIINIVDILFENINLNHFDYYISTLDALKKVLSSNNKVLKFDILLSLSLALDLGRFNESPKGLTSQQIEHYLKITDDYDFLTQILLHLTKYLTSTNVNVYSESFTLLLPYLKNTDKEIFYLINDFSTRLLEIESFDKANELYRYMLGLKINSCLCYKGLLLSKHHCKKMDELVKVKKLFNDELFKAVLHIGKDEDEKIYNECLHTYEIYKSKKNKKGLKNNTSNVFFDSTLYKVLKGIYIFVSVVFYLSGFSSFFNMIIYSIRFWPIFVGACLGLIVTLPIYINANDCETNFKIIIFKILSIFLLISFMVVGNVIAFVVYTY